MMLVAARRWLLAIVVRLRAELLHQPWAIPNLKSTLSLVLVLIALRAAGEDFVSE